MRAHGDFEGWIKSFLRGVVEVSLEATETARAIPQLRKKHRTLLTANGFATANDTIARFVKLGLLQEITGKQRGRLFAYVPYLQIFTEAGVGLDRADSALASD